jgi:hypothetical protein
MEGLEDVAASTELHTRNRGCHHHLDGFMASSWSATFRYVVWPLDVLRVTTPPHAKDMVRLLPPRHVWRTVCLASVAIRSEW